MTEAFPASLNHAYSWTSYYVGFGKVLYIFHTVSYLVLYIIVSLCVYS